MAKTAKKKTTRKSSARKPVKKTAKVKSNGLRLNDDTEIKVVSTTNPFKENSVKAIFLEMAKKCKTVGDFKKKYPEEETKARAYLRWLINNGDVKTIAA